MKSLIAVVAVLVGLALVGTPADASAKAKVSTLKGYLVDASCATKLVKKDYPMEKAAGHTRECALMEACAASGYGVVTGGKFVKFDDKGSRTAKDLLEKSTRKDHMYVEVSGEQKSGMLTVSSIKEAELPTK